LISIEYADDWNRKKIPYYPINNERNTMIYDHYFKMVNKEQHVLFGGRLAEYRYYDMHMVVGSALTKIKQELSG